MNSWDQPWKLQPAATHSNNIVNYPPNLVWALVASYGFTYATTFEDVNEKWQSFIGTTSVFGFRMSNVGMRKKQGAGFQICGSPVCYPLTQAEHGILKATQTHTQTKSLTAGR